MEALGTAPVGDEKVSLLALLRRPELAYAQLDRLARELDPAQAHNPSVQSAVMEQLEIQTKYEGYITRQVAQVAQSARMEVVQIPDDVDYSVLRSISHEGREKLEKIRPRTLGQAARIPGLRPGDIQILYIHLEQSRRRLAATGELTPA